MLYNAILKYTKIFSKLHLIKNRINIIGTKQYYYIIVNYMNLNYRFCEKI